MNPAMAGAARTLALVALLALVLTWLLVRGTGPDGAAFTAVQASLDHFALNEAALHRDVLRARDGLLQTYDPLVTEIEELQQASRALQDGFVEGLLAPGPVKQLAAAAMEQERQVEQFKTANAQLQNSLAYFDLLSFRTGRAGADPVLASKVGELGSAMLHMTRNPAPEIAALVGRLLTEVGGPVAHTQPAATQDALTTLVRHGRLLTELLPVMDAGIAELFAMPVDRLLADIRADGEARRRDGMQTAQRFRLALYGAALLLLAVAARAAWQLRASARLLQRRAALEHVIAGLSTGFIGCPPDQVASRVGEALAMLGPAFGADRAYFLPAVPALDSQHWAPPGVAAPPPGWPDAALRLAPDAAAGAAWHHVTAALPAGGARDTLARAKVSAWAGVALQHGGRRLGLLGLDRTGAVVGWPYGGLGLLRMAGDVLSHALYSRIAAQERAELRARLLRARRLETLGLFASGIAHNFNNIIGAVIGHAEMASDRLEPLAPAAGHVHEIYRAGERARELVGQILDFGASGRVRREPVSLDALLAETVAMLRAALPPGIALQVGPPAGAWVSGDPGQLQQVLANLIRNASQAITPPGEIMIAVGMHDIAAPRSLSHGSLTAGSHVCIEVADTGAGMDSATQARVFDPFFTTRPAGTGLGLATVHAIIGEYGGVIDVRSTPGGGSSFSVWLPALPVPGEGAGAAWRGRGQTVLLLAVGEAAVLHDEEMLAALGFEPVGYTSPQAALAACRSRPGGFDAMLVEVGAGEEDDTVAALHATCPGCPIILIVPPSSGKWDESRAVALASGVLSRPLRSAALAVTLSNCLIPAGAPATA